MSDETASDPTPRSLRENIALISSPDNILLRIPIRQLPRLRIILILFRIVLIVAGLVKLFWLVVPQSHIGLFLLDLIFGTPIIVFFTFLAAWGHARDIHEKFQIEQLRVIPHGDQFLSRALALRPLSGILLPLAIYYFASLFFGCLNILLTYPEFFDLALIGICLIIIAYQGPWLVIMAGVMLSITANTVRAVSKVRGTMASACLEAFGRLLVAMIFLIGGVTLVVMFVFSFFYAGSGLGMLIPTVIVSTPLMLTFLLVGLVTVSWMANALERLDADLEAYWKDAGR